MCGVFVCVGGWMCFCEVCGVVWGCRFAWCGVCGMCGVCGVCEVCVCVCGVVCLRVCVCGVGVDVSNKSQNIYMH